MSASVSNENVPILNLPWEIQDKILAYVGDPALTAKVCKLWRDIVASDGFYANILDTIRRCCGSSETFNRLKACAYVLKADNSKKQVQKLYRCLKFSLEFLQGQDGFFSAALYRKRQKKTCCVE